MNDASIEERAHLRHCQTLTGGIWFPDAPRPEDVNPADFRVVARVNRFGGHTKESVDFYSVAQHLWLCSEWVGQNGGTPQDQYDALTHDLEEIYPPGDQLGPILRGELPGSSILEMSRKAKLAVRTAIGATLVKSEIVSMSDRVLLATEKRDLLNTPSLLVKWTELPEPWNFDLGPIIAWAPRRAWGIWAVRFNVLADALKKPLLIPGV